MIPALSLEQLRLPAAVKMKPFLEEILSTSHERIHSIYVTGTSITDDFHEKLSDVNSIIVLKEMDIRFLDLLITLGKRYSKHRIAAPLIMTPDYIKSSLDVFPVEFLNFKLIHATVFGEDIFNKVEFHRMDLRRQCERELKVKLLALRQGYVSSLGDRKILTEGLAKSITGHMPLFRGIITLLNQQPPVTQAEVIRVITETAHLSTDVFTRVLRLKHEKIKLSSEELHSIFEDYYAATEKLGRTIDEISA